MTDTSSQRFHWPCRTAVKDLVDALHLEHPSNQATIASTMLKALNQWARECRDGRRYDARNKFAVQRVLMHLKPMDDPDYLMDEHAEMDAEDGEDTSDRHLEFYSC